MRLEANRVALLGNLGEEGLVIISNGIERMSVGSLI